MKAFGNVGIYDANGVRLALGHAARLPSPDPNGALASGQTNQPAERQASSTRSR